MSHSDASNKTTIGLLTVLDYATPIILLFFFLSVFTLRSVLSADHGNIRDTQSPTTPPVVEYGPGGKPLPPNKPRLDETVLASLDFSRSRKLLFRSLAVFTAGTFLANGAVVCLHALVDRKHHWWCGQSYTVRPQYPRVRYCKPY